MQKKQEQLLPTRQLVQRTRPALEPLPRFARQFYFAILFYRSGSFYTWLDARGCEHDIAQGEGETGRPPHAGLVLPAAHTRIRASDAGCGSSIGPVRRCEWRAVRSRHAGALVILGSSSASPPCAILCGLPLLPRCLASAGRICAPKSRAWLRNAAQSNPSAPRFTANLPTKTGGEAATPNANLLTWVCTPVTVPKLDSDKPVAACSRGT